MFWLCYCMKQCHTAQPIYFSLFFNCTYEFFCYCKVAFHIILMPVTQCTTLNLWQAHFYSLPLCVLCMYYFLKARKSVIGCV